MVTNVTDPRKPLGRRIKQLRNKAGLTQEQLAEASGLHWTYISGIERGVRNASITSIYQIASALRLRVRDLVKDL